MIFFAAYTASPSVLNGEKLTLTGIFGDEDGEKITVASLEGDRDNPKELGSNLAKLVLKKHREE